MIDLFSSIPIRAQDVTGNFIQAQIQIHEKELFTGLFHINGNGEGALLFAQGKLFAVYRLSNDVWLNVPKTEWGEQILASSGDLRVTSVNIEGLRIFRLFFESDFSVAKTNLSLPANELYPYVNRWQRGDKAGIALIRQDDKSALMLFPAREMIATEAILINNSQTQTGIGVANQVKAWGDRPCQVALCTYEENSEAWKEYSLRVSFGHFVQNILHRYEELAGHFLVADLDEQINEETKDWGLAFSLYGNNLSNRQFFETTERAGQAYMDIFNMIGRQMEGVIGKKVAINIRKDAVTQLGSDARMLVQQYIFSGLDQDAGRMVA